MSQRSQSQKSSSQPAGRKKSLDRSQASQSQATQGISKEEMKALAADVVKYILHRQHENKISKRTDIITHVIKGKTRRFDELMDKVGKRFDKVLGLKLVNINNENKFYTLRNKLEEKEGSLSLFSSPMELARDGLLSIVLSFLFCVKKPIREERVYGLLKNLGIIENENHLMHDELGDIKKLLCKEWVELQWLKYSDSETHDPDDKVKVFHWGDRAHTIIGKADVFNFMGKVYDCDTNIFEANYDDVGDKFNHSDDDD